jgi:signal transduction histidine kinase
MSDDVETNLPMPWKYFKLFLLFWHVGYLGTLAFVLGLELYHSFGSWGTQQLFLTACVAGQVGLYVAIVIVNERWPLPGWQALVYFGGSFMLWAIEWTISENFAWVGWMNLGQMFGILPPVMALPGAVTIVFYFYWRVVGWDISQIPIGAVFATILMAATFLYMYSLMRTSMGRGQLIQELEAARIELEKSRQNELELAALRERERLAREMHDGLGHNLVAISVQLEAVQRLYRVDPERASQQVDALKNLARSSMEELRRSIAGLRAAGLGERALGPALNELCVEFGARSGLSVSCQAEGDDHNLPPAVAEALWRVAQEALTNVEKHAQARSVAVSVTARDGQVVLCVCDDGIGIPAQQLASMRSSGGHYGLMGMRERIEGLGGRVKIELRAESGLCVEAAVPLDERAILQEPAGEHE